MTPSELFNYLMKDPLLKQKAMQFLVDQNFLGANEKVTIIAQLQADKAVIDAKLVDIQK